MKNQRTCLDLNEVFDEIFDAARQLSDEFHRNFTGFQGMPGGGHDGHDGHFHHHHSHSPFAKFAFDENTDYYPNYSYPPMNVFMGGDRSLTFEFALAGFEEKNISLSFQGDYMVFSAQIECGGDEDSIGNCCKDDEDVHYFKRRLKLKDIEKQKYFVPLDKYDQDKVKAVFKNGILRVTVPPKAEPDQNDGIKIEIVKEGV